jgi:hypothetical protein
MRAQRLVTPVHWSSLSEDRRSSSGYVIGDGKGDHAAQIESCSRYGSHHLIVVDLRVGIRPRRSGGEHGQDERYCPVRVNPIDLCLEWTTVAVNNEDGLAYDGIAVFVPVTYC